MSTQIVNISSAFADLQENPVHSVVVGRRDSQMIFGEELETTGATSGEWVEGISVLDGYQGWVHGSHLTSSQVQTTHAVNLRMAGAHPQPSFKTKASLTLTFMSRVAIETSLVPEKGFVAIRGPDEPLWVAEEHLIAIDDLKSKPADIVDTALMFNGCYYGYGGRSFSGLDCSAVIQLALQRNGIFCPRDTDQQMPVLGESVELSDVQRGDIVYFPGHVGIMVDPENILNATVRHMQTIIEPLTVLKEKYSHEGAPAILDIRRIDPPAAKLV